MRRRSAADYALLLLRFSGLLLAFGHGWGKVFALATGDGAWVVASVDRLGFPAPLLFAWALALAEFVGGIAMALGLYTRAATASISFAMFVAAFVRHRAIFLFLSWIHVLSPTAEELDAAGNPERALLFLLISLAVLIAGPGGFSLDAKLQDRRR